MTTIMKQDVFAPEKENSVCEAEIQPNMMMLCPMIVWGEGAR